MKHLATAFLALSLAACASQKPDVIYPPVEVKVPVPVHRVPPADLLVDIAPAPDLKFIAPSDAAASSALSPAGERALRRLVRELNARLEAWKSWAAE